MKEDARAMDGRGRERERADGRTDERTNRATKLRPVEWEMDAALKAKEKAKAAMGGGGSCLLPPWGWVEREGESKRPLEAMRYGRLRRRKYRQAAATLTIS